MSAPVPTLFRRIVFVLAAISAVMGIAFTAHAQSKVTDVRVGVHQGFTRFVLELDASAPYRLLTLRDPYRVVIDLPEVAWETGDDSAGKVAKGVIGKFRFGLFQHGVSRFVIDLREPAVVKAHFRLDPEPGAGHRLVVDLEPSTGQQFAAAMGSVESDDWASRLSAVAAATQSQQQAIVRAPVRPSEQVEKRLRTIVIDPGHGGVDPGAIGASGIYEKKITLAFAMDLRDRLQALGDYRVLLTRDRDIYIPLRRRYEVAHRNEADLFISIHADAHHTPDLRGFSVYTLSETASDKEAAALATKENKSDILAGYDLSEYDDQTSFILLDLAQRKTSEASWQFAQSLVKNVGSNVTLLRRPHRFAGFAVLKSPTVPSVLVELGYLSNRREEKDLRTPAYRAGLADAIIRAIDVYFEQQDRLSRS